VLSSVSSYLQDRAYLVGGTEVNKPDLVGGTENNKPDLVGDEQRITNLT